MSSRVKRTTTSAALAALAVALARPGPGARRRGGRALQPGVQHKREGKLTEAVAECQKAIQLRSNYAAAHMTLGSLYRAQNNYAEGGGANTRRW